MNRSKDLRDLFRQTLINERKARATTNYGYQYGNGYNLLGGVHRIPNQYGDSSVRIYFYEWSNLKNAPRIFYQLNAFENFLKTSGIFIEFYQKEIIRNIGTVYATCYTGTKNLNIRGSYKNLRDALDEYDKQKLVHEINTPKTIFEPQNRWPQNDGTFFG